MRRACPCPAPRSPMTTLRAPSGISDEPEHASTSRSCVRVTNQSLFFGEGNAAFAANG
ncbi:hypothetical protein RGR602_CH00990 [Rhizobium gallicum bv. gallicum R602sp]|uniref:Uncharacterized protein n=1 Tax=Rhizobium gallicum bv. gallicum R602sp TaxID=1041138 RepID=A0A0B4X0R1_9HYPH|nr:hypothetical protein RGR602_CH00990 [Rhizobium gallicum bv. gallicum R602sp]